MAQVDDVPPHRVADHAAMKTSRLLVTVFLSILLAACGGKTEPSPSPSPEIAGVGPGGQPNPGGPGGGNAGGQPAGPGGAVPGGPGPGGAGGAGGAGGNTVTRKWSESVTQSGAGMSSVVTQQYTAIVQVTLTSEGPGAWTFTGSADITAAFTSDYQARKADILGAACNVHYTDDASASGTVQIDGGLNASDGFYQFHVNIPGIDTGTNETVRDDSDCDGPNNSETTPWSAAQISAQGSGEYTGSSISGSESTPREGGEDTVTWSFTLPN